MHWGKMGRNYSVPIPVTSDVSLEQFGGRRGRRRRGRGRVGRQTEKIKQLWKKNFPLEVKVKLQWLVLCSSVCWHCRLWFSLHIWYHIYIIPSNKTNSPSSIPLMKPCSEEKIMVYEMCINCCIPWQRHHITLLSTALLEWQSCVLSFFTFIYFTFFIHFTISDNDTIGLNRHMYPIEQWKTERQYYSWNKAC